MAIPGSPGGPYVGALPRWSRVSWISSTVFAATIAYMECIKHSGTFLHEIILTNDLAHFAKHRFSQNFIVFSDFGLNLKQCINRDTIELRRYSMYKIMIVAVTEVKVHVTCTDHTKSITKIPFTMFTAMINF